jgi:hypothetical protein
VFPKYAACEIAFGARARGLIGYSAEDFPLLSVWGVYGSQLAASGALTPKIIETEIRGNPIDPCIKRALETKSRQFYVGAQESFLIDVLTVLLRAG